MRWLRRLGRWGCGRLGGMVWIARRQWAVEPPRGRPLSILLHMHVHAGSGLCASACACAISSYCRDFVCRRQWAVEQGVEETRDALWRAFIHRVRVSHNPLTLSLTLTPTHSTHSHSHSQSLNYSPFAYVVNTPLTPTPLTLSSSAMPATPDMPDMPASTSQPRSHTCLLTCRCGKTCTGVHACCSSLVSCSHATHTTPLSHFSHTRRCGTTCTWCWP